MTDAPRIIPCEKPTGALRGVPWPDPSIVKPLVVESGRWQRDAFTDGTTFYGRFYNHATGEVRWYRVVTGTPRS